MRMSFEERKEFLSPVTWALVLYSLISFVHMYILCMHAVGSRRGGETF
jgi:hypothetical protein